MVASGGCLTHTIAGTFELFMINSYQLDYTLVKRPRGSEGETWCRLFSKAPESVAYILTGCSALPQSKYLSQNDALKLLFYEMLCDLELVDEVLHWYSAAKPKAVYESDDVQAYCDVPVLAEQEE